MIYFKNLKYFLSTRGITIDREKELWTSTENLLLTNMEISSSLKSKEYS